MGYVDDLVKFLGARYDEAWKALIAYREHRERGDHVNYKGQDPADYDGYDSCSRCIATSKAALYSDIGYGLAEIEAKRRIIDEHLAVGRGDVCYSLCHEKAPGVPQSFPCRTLRLLALPHADHPDYREEWRP